MNPVTPEEVGLSAERLARIRPVMQGYVDRRTIAGALTLIVRHGKLAHLECVGWMDVEAGKPMRPDAIFRIYSMTKPLTSVALLMLLEQGRLLLADPISKYVPAFRDAKVYVGQTEAGLQVAPLEREITLYDLLTHTAGLTYDFLLESPVDELYSAAALHGPLLNLNFSLADLARLLTSLPLANQPGARWRYSHATDVLGHVIELVSNMPLADFVAEKIFKPLGMNDTGFYVAAEKQDRLAACYTPDAAGGITLADAPATSPFLREDLPPSGGAGLVSTATDYARFAQMLLNRGELDGARLLSRKTVELMTTNHLPAAHLPMMLGLLPLRGSGFGLGVSVRLDDSSGVLGSTGMFGWSGAADTHVRIDPREDMFSLCMLQLLGSAEPFSAVFQNLVYQAVVD